MRVVVLDWDDTLFPTTYLTSLGFQPFSKFMLSREVFSEIMAVQQSAMRVLKAARDLGTVYIVTNSTNGWVDICCKTIYRRLAPLLEGVKVISARSEYELFYPNDEVMWKQMAIRDCIRDCTRNGNTIKELISMGDSELDRLASNAAGQAEAVRTKNIKLFARPTAIQLRAQHIAIWTTDKLHQDQPLDLMVVA